MMNSIFYTGLTLPPNYSSDIVHCPTIKIFYSQPSNQEVIEQFLVEKPTIVFFSQNGVEGFERFFQIQSNSIFAVGKKTAQKIWSLWKIKAIEPLEKNALGMCKLFANIEPQSVLVIQGKDGRPEFVDWLQQHHWNFYSALVYTTKIYKNNTLAKNFKNNASEKVIFTSPSTIKGFLKSIGETNLSHVNAKIISIGKTTTATILSLRGNVFFEANKPNVEELLANVVKI